MEDEDGEIGNIDMWKLHNITNDNISVKETLVKNNSTQHLNSIEELKDKKGRINCQKPKSKGSNAVPQILSCVSYKGYKKRILAQTQENESSKKDQISLLRVPNNYSVNSSKTTQPEVKLTKRSNKIAEYAQYLGLQPSSTYFSVSRKNFNGPVGLPSRLNYTLPNMTSSMAVAGSSSDGSTLLSTPNFNRKVYLCSACNIYFENWHLFLHMRDIHERHICLFCLGLFDQVERLSHHLSKNHSIPETEYTSVEDFHRIFRGSCYLICCSCEKVFTESDNFYNHYCTGFKQSSKQATNICSVCKQVNSHMKTCSMAPDTEDELSPNSTIEMNRKMIKYNRLKQAKVRRALGGIEVKNNKSNKSIGYKDKESNTNFNKLAADDDNIQLTNQFRDTVAETIMEVSRCVGDADIAENVFREKDIKDKDIAMLEDVSIFIKTNSIVSDNTDFVMSKNITEIISDKDNEKSHDTEINDVPITSNSIISSEMGNESQIPISSLNDKLEKSPEITNNISCDKVLSINGEHTFSTSSRSSSPVMGSHSVFSPSQSDTPLHISEQEPNLISTSILNDEEQKQEYERITVSNNALPSSDRSLVFKICANKNTFSISKSSKSDNVTRESEENNNSQASTSEIHEWNHCDSEPDGSTKENECESDSDSERLAVVDNNDSDIENKGEDAEEEINENGEHNKVILNLTTLVENNKEVNNLQSEVLENKIDLKELMQLHEIKTEVDGITLAGSDIPCIDLNVEGILETMEIEDLLKRCISAASPTCVYCNHARLVAVNGKQLGLHMLAEHRFQPQHPAIIINMEQFVSKMKKSLSELESCYFNLDSYNTKQGTYNVPTTRIYECFHCRFYSTVHKELYLHNRKMHQKSIILCIMCKSTFHSYSELLCHLCPGIYAANSNIRYRCCLCPVSNLPSAFRLMVHLRKLHHACDVCLESTGNQQRLSNHVWKHKLHHLCYRCGISYRNKPDITKHLFWKHGTESVLCKKCLQKKWPHVYHFCVPPIAFVCEECSTTFTKAVALKVHKRLHSNERPYSCLECSEKFVSRKLLKKHESNHQTPSPVRIISQSIVHTNPDENSECFKIVKDKDIEENTTDTMVEKKENKEIKESIKKVDVLDLPPLNLSSDSDSESDSFEKKSAPVQIDESNVLNSTTRSTEESSSRIEISDSIAEVERDEEEKKQEARIMDGIWDNFKSYTASLNSGKQKLNADTELDIEFLRSVILAEHDYFIIYNENNLEINRENIQKSEISNEVPKMHIQNNEVPAPNMLESSKKKFKSPKKVKQQNGSSSSDSSSDDSSSCTCGTNCSCSSSSSNSSSSSSSSSDSDSSDIESSPKNLSATHKDHKKENKTNSPNHPCHLMEGEVKLENEKQISMQINDYMHSSPIKSIMAPRESDLETDETLTDEDFYDEHPQLLALKMLTEKRNQQLLLLTSVTETSVSGPLIEPVNNGIVKEPINQALNVINEKPIKGRKKVKNKKRKKLIKAGKSKNQTKSTVESIKLNIPKSLYQKKSVVMPSQISDNTLSPVIDMSATITPKVQPMKLVNQNVTMTSENEMKRSSKRKRVPKRFYGDSSDEENDKQLPKWRKAEQNFTIRPSVTNQMSLIPEVSLRVQSPPESPSPSSISYCPPISTTEAVLSGSDSDEIPDSSSDSDSEQEKFSVQQQPLRPNPSTHLAHPSERTDNLYCYCHCPYDEVSEMIACDARDCRIEWFHFECVGIMVPPKGKWYCPDCRRRLGLPQTNEEITHRQ